jgi:hypothetical protein
MTMSGQPHAPATLSHEKKHGTTEQDDGWSPQPVCMDLEKRKLFPLLGIKQI